jgi:hypothetical protein
MDSIFEKGETYALQMQGVRAIVCRFAGEVGWSSQSRGRRAHASIYGSINGLNGVIDVEMDETDWNKMPDALPLAFPFLLWSSASLDVGSKRMFADQEICWGSPFGDLEKHVPLFLASAWGMLNTLSTFNLREIRGPMLKPDWPPLFGPPRMRMRSAN